MSRARPVDNSTAVSLFPFLAVLLCTMGALLVVLVAVSRAAREAALRQATSDHEAVAAEPDPAARRELEKIEQYAANLKELRTAAEQKLREGQARLSHLEDHMRRLQDELVALQLAAAELDALEEEHYDDRAQAEREIERLQRLIEETRSAIARLKDENQPASRRYALVPYEGPNGTYRRPIYVECRQGELILQPEGVRIRRDDLLSPLGPGNVLASALRAARDYYVQLNPAEGHGRDAEPYPLLVVRPEGLLMYDRARQAIESADFEFGFELAEDDWELTYPVGDPQLAVIEQQAIDQARIRQRALAAAAPRAYRHPALAAAGRFDEDDSYGFVDHSGAGGDGGFPGGSPGSEQAGAASSPDGGGGGEHAAVSSDHAAESASPAGANGGTSTEPSAGTATAPDESAIGDTMSPNAAAGAGGQDGNVSPGSEASKQVAASTGAPEPERPHDAPPAQAAMSRGQDWALDRKKPNAVPIRRTIQAVVRPDRVMILSDETQLDAAAPRGKELALQGDTVESLDGFVGAVRAQIEGWGIAGDGLYWRPVLILNADPDGQRRAADLTRLLKGSGLEVRTKAIPESM